MKKFDIKNMDKKKIFKVLRYVVIAILGIALVSALIYFGIKAYGDYKEKKAYSDLADYMNVIPEENKNEVKEKTEKQLKLEELHNEYEDVVGYIYIPDTNISYPVVQGEDNDYYLDHTYQGESSARGSIFLDYHVDLSLPSTNFLIYGHRNKNGAMFDDLIKYESEEFYKEHKSIYFTTLDEDAEYEIVAAFRGRRYYKYETDVFRYYYFINAESEKEFNDFVSNAKKASMYDTGVNAQYGDQLLTLSTCAYHVEHGRFAILARKVTNKADTENNETNQNAE